MLEFGWLNASHLFAEKWRAALWHVTSALWRHWTLETTHLHSKHPHTVSALHTVRNRPTAEIIASHNVKYLTMHNLILITCHKIQNKLTPGCECLTVKKEKSFFEDVLKQLSLREKFPTFKRKMMHSQLFWAVCEQKILRFLHTNQLFKLWAT